MVKIIEIHHRRLVVYSGHAKRLNKQKNTLWMKRKII